ADGPAGGGQRIRVVAAVDHRDPQPADGGRRRRIGRLQHHPTIRRGHRFGRDRGRHAGLPGRQRAARPDRGRTHPAARRAARGVLHRHGAVDAAAGRGDGDRSDRRAVLRPSRPHGPEGCRMTDTPAPAPAPLAGSSWHTEMIDAPGYLAALDIEQGPPTAALLAALHRAHVRTFPFANIDVLLGTHPGVTPDRVYDQLVVRRRGGYCFEHAQLFAAGAEHLGFRVRRSLGRVGSLAQWRTHMSVIVEIGGRRWLCDPGFGFSLTAPLELRDGAELDVLGRTMSAHLLDDDGTAVW